MNRSFFSNRQILRVMSKMIVNRVLTAGLVYRVLVSTAHRKVRKLAIKRGIRMGNVVR